ncbi:hypothetical protein Lsai_1193 [Legionella sainthelensi]|uniref:Uncharacterized protein n=1 Tax=Legionella sainthelensi TaxID=28087 RepID=A0A0W0YNW9_9GAMM|nr:hypothetical protein [Legionella sainthelensi]KTD58586.1 hypothetical protein Lsai_1193 [Legionella sainthelensi]
MMQSKINTDDWKFDIAKFKKDKVVVQQRIDALKETLKERKEEYFKNLTQESNIKTLVETIIEKKSQGIQNAKDDLKSNNSVRADVQKYLEKGIEQTENEKKKWEEFLEKKKTNEKELNKKIEKITEDIESLEVMRKYGNEFLDGFVTLKNVGGVNIPETEREREEFNQKVAGKTKEELSDSDKALKSFLEATDQLRKFLKEIKAFSKTYQLDEVDGVAFWSKIHQRVAIKLAEKQGLTVLEGTIVGLFDGLNFGYPWIPAPPKGQAPHKPNPYVYMWQAFSEDLAVSVEKREEQEGKRIKGQDNVHAFLFQNMQAGAVIWTTELNNLLTKVDNEELQSVTLHYYDKVNHSDRKVYVVNDQTTAEKAEKKDCYIFVKDLKTANQKSPTPGLFYKAPSGNLISLKITTPQTISAASEQQSTLANQYCHDILNHFTVEEGEIKEIQLPKIKENKESCILIKSTKNYFDSEETKKLLPADSNAGYILTPSQFIYVSKSGTYNIIYGPKTVNEPETPNQNLATLNNHFKNQVKDIPTTLTDNDLRTISAITRHRAIGHPDAHRPIKREINDSPESHLYLLICSNPGHNFDMDVVEENEKESITITKDLLHKSYAQFEEAKKSGLCSIEPVAEGKDWKQVLQVLTTPSFIKEKDDNYTAKQDEWQRLAALRLKWQDQVRAIMDAHRKRDYIKAQLLDENVTATSSAFECLDQKTYNKCSQQVINFCERKYRELIQDSPDLEKIISDLIKRAPDTLDLKEINALNKEPVRSKDYEELYNQIKKFRTLCKIAIKSLLEKENLIPNGIQDQQTRDIIMNHALHQGWSNIIKSMEADLMNKNGKVASVELGNIKAAGSGINKTSADKEARLRHWEGKAFPYFKNAIKSIQENNKEAERIFKKAIEAISYLKVTFDNMDPKEVLNHRELLNQQLQNIYENPELKTALVTLGSTQQKDLDNVFNNKRTEIVTAAALERKYQSKSQLTRLTKHFRASEPDSQDISGAQVRDETVKKPTTVEAESVLSNAANTADFRNKMRDLKSEVETPELNPVVIRR